MLKILDFAKLALYSYKDIAANKKYLPDYVYNTPLDPEQFKHEDLPNYMYEVIVDPLIQSFQAQQHSFYASLFVKVHERKAVGAVIAVRGTVPSNTDNLAQDVRSWWKGIFDAQAKLTLPQAYLAQAMHFYSKVKHFIHAQLKLPLHKLFVTGHSLGGAIAALLPAYDRLPIRAVTFNAPGIKEMPGVHNTIHSIINIHATYDFVSSIDEPIGPQVNIFVPEHVQQAETTFKIAQEHEREGWTRLDVVSDMLESADFLVSFLAQHSMANLLMGIEGVKDNNIAHMDYTSLEHRLLPFVAA